MKKDKKKLELRRPKLTLIRLTTRDLLQIQGGLPDDGADTTGSRTCVVCP